MPILNSPTKSLIEAFYQSKDRFANRPFLGTRPPQPDGSFGPYEWMTYARVFEVYEEIAKGSKILNLFQNIPGINEDGKEWAFCGIWSKNRWEWHVTQLAAMVLKATVVGFYDSMGDSSVDYCMNQTRLETMFVSAGYLKKLLGMREAGMAQYLKTIVLFDVDAETSVQKERARGLGIEVHMLDDVRQAGRDAGSDVTLDPSTI